MTNRCEPPEPLRGVDGHFWLEHDKQTGKVFMGRWRHAAKVWTGDLHLTDEDAACFGWRLICPVTPPDVVRGLVAALEKADQFITNGIELGFIRMPNASTPDPAHKTPGIVADALRRAKEAGL